MCWPTPSPVTRTSLSVPDASSSPGCAQTTRTDPCNGCFYHRPSDGEEEERQRKGKSSLNGSSLIMWSIKQQTKRKRELRTHSEGSGVRVEDVDPELLECFLKDEIHHGVLLTIFRIEVCNLKEPMSLRLTENDKSSLKNKQKIKHFSGL